MLMFLGLLISARVCRLKMIFDICGSWFLYKYDSRFHSSLRLTNCAVLVTQLCPYIRQSSSKMTEKGSYHVIMLLNLILNC